MRIALALAAATALSAPVVVAAADPVAMPVLSHRVARGDILSAADFETRAMSAAQGNGILAPASADGREAVRDLAAGMPVRAADVVTPRLVRRGEPVVIAWRSGGLSITTSGRALTSGGSGDFIRVVAASTNRTLDATVEGRGAVAVQ